MQLLLTGTFEVHQFSDRQHTQANALAHILVNADLCTNPALRLFNSISSFGKVTETSFINREQVLADVANSPQLL
jgi:hypothetical protein